MPFWKSWECLFERLDEGKNGKNILHSQSSKEAEIFDKKKESLSIMRALQGLLPEVRYVPTLLAPVGLERRIAGNCQGFLVREII